jgi:hypothetical protein
VGEIVHRSDDVVVELEHIRVYPNGFTINLFIVSFRCGQRTRSRPWPSRNLSIND